MANTATLDFSWSLSKRDFFDDFLFPRIVLLCPAGKKKKRKVRVFFDITSEIFVVVVVNFVIASVML